MPLAAIRAQARLRARRLVRKVQVAINNMSHISGNILLVTECERTVRDRHPNSAANDG